MTHRFNAERQRELDERYAALAVFAAFLDAETERPSGRSVATALSEAYERRDLAGLRMVCNDVIGMLPAYTPVQRRELDRRLREGLGTTLDTLEAQQLERIPRVRSLGRISSEQRYYMIGVRIELIHGDPERDGELHVLQAILDAYEAHVARRKS